MAMAMSRLVRLQRRRPTASVATAIATFLAEHDLSPGSQRVYAGALRSLQDGLGAGARLFYRRAAELFSEATPGWTLHQLRHSALTHAAEDGTNTPILLARSRHTSVRSLERYARPGPEAIARYVAEHDPARRRR